MAGAAPSDPRDIVVVGASSGGVAALRTLVSQLPGDYRGALFVAMHVSAEAEGRLAAILDAAGPLRAQPAEDGMSIEPGRILVAPPDRHLLVLRERVAVVRGPRENRHRPAIDPLFRSAAWAFGPRVVGVVLTGELDDGSAGLWAVKSCGGTSVVQDPDDAAHAGMPASALTHNSVDHRLPLREIAPLLARLAGEPAGAAPPPDPASTIVDEVGSALLVRGLENTPPLGVPSVFTCPGCGGALWELQDGGDLRYRCHTGHGYSQAALLDGQSDAIERSLYTALRALEEKAAALRRIAGHWQDRFPHLQADYEQRAQELDGAARVLRAMLATGLPP